MKNTGKLSLIIIIILLISCNRKDNGSHKAENFKSPYEVDVSYKSNSKIKTSSFIEDFKIVQLSTSNDNLIFEISKIQYMNEKIYILDISGNRMFIFNNDGTLYKKLDKRGLGPGEYIQLMDFYIDEDILHVLDYTQQAILSYDSNLEFINKTNYKSFGSRFTYHNKSYWNYNEPSGQKSDYQFSSYTKEGKSIKNFLPRNSTKHQYNWAGVNVFALNGEKKYLSPRYDDIIYSITDDNIKPEYVINFNERKFPENKNINNYDLSDPNFSYFVKENFYKSTRYLIFDFTSKRKRNFCIHDIEKKTTKSGEIDNDLITDFRFFPRWGNDNYLIEELGSEILVEHFNSSPQFVKFTNVIEGDNPFIIIYKLKS